MPTTISPTFSSNFSRPVAGLPRPGQRGAYGRQAGIGLDRWYRTGVAEEVARGQSGRGDLEGVILFSAIGLLLTLVAIGAGWSLPAGAFDIGDAAMLFGP